MTYMNEILGKLFMVKNDNSDVKKERKRRNSVFEEPNLQDLNFCSKKESVHYAQMKDNISNKKCVKKTDLLNLLSHILKDRQRFKGQNGNWKFAVCYIFERVCPFRFCCKNAHRSQKVYENALKHFHHELDVVKILKSVRMMKVFMWSNLTKQQRFMMKLQKT